MIFRILSKEEKSTTALLLYRYLIEKAYKESDIDLSSNADKYYLTVNYLIQKHQINPLSTKEKKALFELLYGYMTEETEEMHRLEDEVPDLYKSLINDMINFEMIRRSYRYICTALDKDIVKGDVNDGQ